MKEEAGFRPKNRTPSCWSRGEISVACNIHFINQRPKVVSNESDQNRIHSVHFYTHSASRQALKRSKDGVSIFTGELKWWIL